MTAIKQEKIFGEAVTQAGRDPAPDIFAGPACTEALAFKVQECNLVEWIHGSQTRVKLQAIDDPDRISKPNVLGTQVAVPINNASIPNPPDKQPAVAL